MILNATIRKIIFQNGDYTVMACSPDEPIPGEYLNPDYGTVVVAGNCLPKNQDISIQFEGEWRDTKRGKTFIATSMSGINIPINRSGIISYLKTLDNIGPKTAEKIYDYFGDQTLNTIEQNPDKIRELRGISKKQTESIIEAISNDPIRRKSMLVLMGLGLSDRKANKAIKKLGINAGAKIATNPFVLCEIDHGTFRKAEHISTTTNVAQKTSDRVLYGVIYALKQCLTNGDSFALYDDLVQKSQAVFETPVSAEAIEKAIEYGVTSKEFFVSDTGKRHVVYPYCLYKAESQVAFTIAEMLVQPRKTIDEKSINAAIFNAQKSLSFILDESQVAAIKRTLSSSISVITGGPGTGKTTILKVLVQAYKELYPGITIRLAAPTGRAAKKMMDDSGQPAYTIHYTYRVHAASEDGDDSDDEDPGLTYQPIQKLLASPTVGDKEVVIIDESSMADISISRLIMIHMSRKSQIVFMGDVDQLPSVGPGNVLADLIRCGEIPVSYLKMIHRQAQESQIVLNADKIKNGITELATGVDFIFKSLSSEMAEQYIVKVFVSEIKKGIPLMDIQILSPYKKEGVCCSTNSLNVALQDKLNPARPTKNEFTIGCQTFREGDKIIQGKNDNSFKSGDDSEDTGDIIDNPKNGDIGIIKQITDKIILIDYNGKTFECDRKYFIDYKIKLGYAITVHKAQGSEFPYVLIPVVSEHSFILKRKIIYTALTRASKKVVFAGQRWVLNSGIKKIDAGSRNSLLAERIISYKKRAKIQAESKQKKA